MTALDIAAMSPEDVSRAHLALVALTLDLARPALQSWLIETSAVDTAQSALRRAALRYWAGEHGELHSAQAERAFVASVISDLKGGDPGTSNALLSFLQQGVLANEAQRAQAFLWEQLIVHGDTFSVRPKSPPPFVARLRAGLEQGNGLRLARTPETAWDREVYERYGYTLEPLGAADERSPLDALEAALTQAKFVFTWRAALGPDIETDIQDLVTWGTRHAPDLGLPTELLGRPNFGAAHHASSS
jgi:hypothetical protein